MGVAGTGLLAQAAAAAETVLVRQAADGMSWFAIAVGISQIIIAGAILTLVVATVVVGLALLRKVREKGSVLGQVLNDLIPLVRRMNRLTERLEAIAETAKSSVDRVDGTVRDATTRVTRLLDGTERRVREFDALVDVARDRADDAFVGSVAALRGVRAGARALRNGRARNAGPKGAGEEPGEPDAELLEERLEHAIDVEGELRAGEEVHAPRVRGGRRERHDPPLDETGDLTATEGEDDASIERPRIRPRA